MSWFGAVTLVLVGVSLGAASAQADAPYLISGTIRDASGTGINGLGLALYDSTTAEVGAAPTNADGTYSFSVLASDTYTLTTASGGGYLATSSAINVSTGDVVFNLTDPRFTSITGVVSGGASAGVAVSASVGGHSAADTTNAGGAFAVTLPAVSGSYAFTFTTAAGVKLAITSYSVGSGTIAVADACLLSPDAASRATLFAGGPVTLSVALDSNQTVCSPAVAAPATTKHHSTLLAQTGSATADTPTPSPTSAMGDADSSTSPVSTVAGAAPRKPLLTATASTSVMPGWAWALIIVAVLALLGGVGFTVVRHR